MKETIHEISERITEIDNMHAGVTQLEAECARLAHELCEAKHVVANLLEQPLLSDLLSQKNEAMDSLWRDFTNNKRLLATARIALDDAEVLLILDI